MSQLSEHNLTTETNSLIRYIVEHTHGVVGREYFRLLVKHLSAALSVSGAWVTEYFPEESRLTSLACWLNGKYVEQYEYHVSNTPCERVVRSRDCFLISDKVIELFPLDPDLKSMGAVSYMGVPLFDKNNVVIGHLAILHDAPLFPSREQEAIFILFAQRANAEFLRLKAEEKLVEKELRLSTLINSIHNAVLEMDLSGFITYANPASNTLFGTSSADHVKGTLVYSLFDEDSGAFLRDTLRSIRDNAAEASALRMNKNLCCITMSGESIPVEGSVCNYEVKGKQYVTLVLHSLKELRRAERRLQIIEEQQFYQGGASGIVGQSRKLKKAMDDAALVARSSSTILLLGESGTGKEVFARYIYDLSDRNKKPFIKVNCAAIPANLIESEFFGHEKGAFTGALTRREGRFSLADNGTLFLDEVGELPIEMQPKLLRVLQEGEFEPIGSQRTLKVNVRIIAATNRDLLKMVKAGTFREDLYYRLNVIPITLPPLRSRGDDVISLANMFIKNFARATGKDILPINDSDARLLLQYPWPGNVRELKHVIERAVVLSRHSRLELGKFIPLTDTEARPVQEVRTDKLVEKVLTIAEIENIERNNIMNALNLCSWKISGVKGAAQVLGIPPSTLHSKIKALNITRS